MCGFVYALAHEPEVKAAGRDKRKFTWAIFERFVRDIPAVTAFILGIHETSLRADVRDVATKILSMDMPPRAAAAFAEVFDEQFVDRAMGAVDGLLRKLGRSEK